jgi:hypothetical protein
VKKKPNDKPYVSNYPPLQAWLQKIGARCLQQTPVGSEWHVKEYGFPAAYLETWQNKNGRVFLVEVRAMGSGWEIWTASGVNDTHATLADAEKRLGLS